ncbi:amino acid ABC transporter ATP-binding/permease protein [Methylophaga sp.]|uniref:amino acid ABC transporter ATP-binding/permease protein n=1 Tax=Methylophaga sp. TaxID=2024840 RepID=UPI002723AD61|nr:ATP-binding cassette domain-containing protein [Methylophaga sp.]MDO8825041.1 ATP-binding cassette domain-containing protein [Methylophaga sp.]
MLNTPPNTVSPIRFWLDKVLAQQKKRLIIGLLLALVTAVSAMGLLALSGWLITATAITGLAITAGSAVMLDIYRPGGGIRFFALSRTVGRYFERLHNHDMVLRVIAGFRGSLFGGLLALPVQDLRNTQDSEWLSRLTADLDNLDSLVLRLLLPPLVAIFSVLLIAVFISFFWAKAGLLFALITLIPGMIYFSLFTRKTSQISSDYASQINQARLLTIEHLQGQLELQAAHLHKAHQTQLNESLNQIGALQLKLNQLIANAQFVVNICHSLLVIMVAIAALFAYQNGIFSGPVAVMLFLAVFGLAEILLNLPGQLGQWGRTRYAAERLQPLAEHTPLKSQELAEVHRLSMMLAEHPKVISTMDTAIAFELSEPQCLLITGRSGSGKSTLANIIAGLEIPDSANTPYQLLVNGIPLRIEQTQAWHQQIGYLTQQNSIIAATLYSNLTLGLEDIDEKQLWQVLALVELENWAKQLPAGLHSWLGDTGSQLSGGQARRICLARLLLRTPGLILLDEPFNGIDTEMAQRIWQRLYPYWQDKMLIVLMHQRPDYFPEVDNQQCFEINLDLKLNIEP